jgi:3D-(3,5/4)-trihydroxycyclohexane-1,2-dione acylhydrolase (decyclizing)
VEGEAFDYDEKFFEKRVHYIDRKLPNDRELNGAAELIKASKKPLVVVGGGAKYSESREALIEFSQKYNIPLVETQAGKSTVESSFKNNFGGLGITGTQAANKAAQQADLIIGVGTRFTDFSTLKQPSF